MTPDNTIEQFIFTDAEVKLGFPETAPFSAMDDLKLLALNIRQVQERRLEKRQTQYITRGYPPEYVRENMTSRSLITLAGVEAELTNMIEDI